MSWSCPHQIKDGYCELRKKKCEPTAKGCVLSGKYKLVDLDEDKFKSDNSKNG